MKHFVDHASLRRWTLSSLAFVVGCFVFAQNIQVGTWRTHFSYSDARHLAITPDKIFCAASTGFFSREIGEGSLRKLSKIDGLSDVGVSALAYNENTNVLVIGYESGFIDFVFDDELLSISDLASSNLEGDKTINAIAFSGSNTYIATDLGVVVTNTEDASITENYVQIGTGGITVEVLQIIANSDSLFIRTNEGIQSGRFDANLLDFSSWTRYPSTVSYTNLISINDVLYATSGLDLQQFSNGSWIDAGFNLPDGASKLFSVNEELMTASNGTIYQLESSGFEANTNTTASSINDIAFANGELIIADGIAGLTNQEGDQLSPSGPLSDSFSNFRVISNELYGFHAPSPFFYNGLQQVTQLSKFTEGEWQIQGIPNFTNVSDVARFNGNFYYSSIGSGLYDESNDLIITNIPGSSAVLDTVITALASGEKLWVSSFRNENPIHLMDQDQNWVAFASNVLGSDEYLTIDLSQIEVGWLGSSTGIITVFYEEENLIDQISTSDGLPSSFIDIDISVEDNAWVGTTRGPALFPDASFIFSNSDGIQPTFENRTLFENEQISAVMTDGGNRIWFGTNQGLWVYDENTSEQIAVFNEANSPLPSNQIIQLAYDGVSGEVFVYTAQGMVSYRSSSSIGSRNHRNVTIFPNPIRPEYQGLVGLSGLARNANVKVTDVNGNLVKEIDANGASASWDLTDMNGSKVTTGVYFFFSSTSNGEETYVGKIAVVR